MTTTLLTSLDHVIVRVSDLEQAVRETTALFGRAPSWRGLHPALGTGNALFQLRNTALELLAPAGEGPVASLLEAELAERGPGVFGLAFATGDAEACRRELEARGMHPAAPQPGEGIDSRSGAVRRWRNVHLPPAETRGVLLFAIEREGDAQPPCAPEGPEAAAVSALDHVVVMSSDAEATRALYGERLGLRLALDREFPKFGSRLLFFRVGGTTVEVGAPLGAEPDPAAADRLFGLAWQVPDLTASRERLLAAGVEVSSVRPGRKPGTRVCTPKSHCCGVPTLLIEPAAGDAKAQQRERSGSASAGP